MSWKIKEIKNSDECSDKYGSSCLNKNRIYYRNPTVSHRCRKDKCPKRANKFNIGDKVLVEFEVEYGFKSVVTDWQYSPKTGYSYEVEERPGRYWSEERVKGVADDK